VSTDTEKKWYAPNGSLIDRTKEVVWGTCGFIAIHENGTPEYDGCGTYVDWDSQQQIAREGQPVYLDEAGEEWAFRELLHLTNEEWEARFKLPEVPSKPGTIDITTYDDITTLIDFAEDYVDTRPELAAALVKVKQFIRDGKIISKPLA